MPGRQRILAVEDVPIFQSVLQVILSPRYNLTIAADGMEAWETLQKSPFDLVVTDCQMPRMNGLELCRRIREFEATKKLPVIFVTAKAYEIDFNEVEKDYSPCMVLKKPFSGTHLLRLIEDCFSTPMTESAAEK